MGQAKNERMKELVSLLNKASRAYYQEAQEIMSNYEYDRLYDELKELEDELGITLSNSPTVNVGYEVVSELPKERHESPMLSLDKTKEVEELKNFVGDQTYRVGMLYKSFIRGNGEVGEVITNNAKVFKNVPVQIAYQGELILRGEAVIGYKDFEKINQEIDEYVAAKEQIIREIRELRNAEYIQVLYKVYVQYKNLKTAAVEMQRSYNNVILIHKQALKESKNLHPRLYYLC